MIEGIGIAKWKNIILDSIEGNVAYIPKMESTRILRRMAILSNLRAYRLLSHIFRYGEITTSNVHVSVTAIRKEETKANKPTTSSFDNLDRSSFDPSSSVYHIFNNDESNSYICVSIL